MFVIILFHFNELPRFITIYLSVLVSFADVRILGLYKKNNFVYILVASSCKFFFLYILVLMRTALGHKAEIFILISFPLSCENNSLLFFLFLVFAIHGVKTVSYTSCPVLSYKIIIGVAVV